MPTPEQVLVPASDSVTLDGISGPLLEYVVRLGYLHWLLFGVPLQVARVYQPISGAPTPYLVCKALAFDVEYLDGEDQFIFASLVAYSAPANQCVMSDMRALPPGKRITVEYHGE